SRCTRPGMTTERGSRQEAHPGMTTEKPAPGGASWNGEAEGCGDGLISATFSAASFIAIVTHKKEEG
ncbi:MAG: hypothetical protein ACRECG_00965, partial [Bradyrhizobium sp.]